MADAAIDGDRVPRLADADPVDLARRERIGGKGRAGYDDLDIDIGLDANACQPITQHIIMARIAVHDAEAQPLARRLARRRDHPQRRAGFRRVAERVAEARLAGERG